jgi:hypothetical protein
MNFGKALEAMKNGECVRRVGWNGKGMHIYIEDYFGFVVPAGVFTGEKRKYAPCIVMFTAQSVHQPGWLANQADMLSEDWEVVPYEELNRK